MIKLKRNLKEELSKVTFKDKEYTLQKSEIDDANPINSVFTISNNKESKMISLIAFVNGYASTNDSTINDLVKLVNKESKEVSKTQEKPINEPKVDEKQKAIEDAREDFFAHPKNTTYFKKLEKELPVTEYERAYYNEFKRLQSSPTAKKRRITTETISNTYPGDVDELLDWLNNAIVSIDVISGDTTMNNAKDIVSVYNDRDKTDYEVKYNPTKFATSFIASLTTKEDILNKMPEEVKEWKVKKNIGKLSQYAYDTVYNQEDNTLTSNAIIFDLIDTYKFKLGKQ